MDKKILFVCTGNICRSPMAEYYLRKLLAEKNIGEFDVGSAGIIALGDFPAASEAREIMQAYGISLDEHLSSPLTLEKVESAYLILVMEKAHKNLIEARIPRMTHKVKLLGSYIDGEQEIIDPYGSDETVYQESFQQIKLAVENLLKELENGQNDYIDSVHP